MMKLALLFLLLGTIFTVISKSLQFKTFNILLNQILIIPAAIFYCLAILVSIPQYRVLLATPADQMKAIFLAVGLCCIMVFVQLITIGAYTERHLGKWQWPPKLMS